MLKKLWSRIDWRIWVAGIFIYAIYLYIAISKGWDAETIIIETIVGCFAAGLLLYLEDIKKVLKAKEFR